MRSTFKSWKFWLSIGVSAVALYLALRDVDFAEFIRAVTTAQAGWLIPAFVAFMIGLVVRALRWATLMGNSHLGITFHAMNIGYMLNMVLPFRVGEIGRAIVIGQRTAVSTATALSSIVVERLLDLAAVVLLFFIFAQFIPMDAALARAATISAGLVVVLIVAIGVVIWQSVRFERILSRLLAYFPRINAQRWLQRYRDFCAGFRLINSTQRFITVLITTIGIWAAQILVAYLTMAAFLPPHVDQAGLMLVAANLGGAAPSAPGGLGPVQLFARVALVVPFKLDPTRATALIFVWSLWQQLALIVLGMIGLVRIGLSLGQLRPAEA
ncbi:MAG: flippase-like domain-containing protein [Thermoflexales bacterium]|nr:flippase-like domain-containing protein [Thermoflexales bacterium]